MRFPMAEGFEWRWPLCFRSSRTRNRGPTHTTSSTSTTGRCGSRASYLQASRSQNLNTSTSGAGSIQIRLWKKSSATIRYHNPYFGWAKEHSLEYFPIFSICFAISLGAWAVVVESVTAHHPGTDPADSKAWLNYQWPLERGSG